MTFKKSITRLKVECNPIHFKDIDTEELPHQTLSAGQQIKSCNVIILAIIKYTKNIQLRVAVIKGTLGYSVELIACCCWNYRVGERVEHNWRHQSYLSNIIMRSRLVRFFSDVCHLLLLFAKCIVSMSNISQVSNFVQTYPLCDLIVSCKRILV